MKQYLIYDYACLEWIPYSKGGYFFPSQKVAEEELKEYINKFPGMVYDVDRKNFDILLKVA